MAKRIVTRKKAAGWRKPRKKARQTGEAQPPQSWQETFQRIGRMVGSEAAEFCSAMAQELEPLEEVTLKDAVALRVYAVLVKAPTPGLLKAVMEREEGKLPTTPVVEKEMVVHVVREPVKNLPPMDSSERDE